jgi:ApaG protein
VAELLAASSVDAPDGAVEGGAVKNFFPYSQTTGGITVSVSVSFLPEQSEPGRGRWFWAYHVRIENQGDAAVQLLSREWMISDGRGGRQEVQGEGVVGEQPVIEPGAAFDYVSGCPLGTPTGFMEGRYHLIGSDGRSFAVAIPRFPLVAPAVARGEPPTSGRRRVDGDDNA